MVNEVELSNDDYDNNDMNKITVSRAMATDRRSHFSQQNRKMNLTHFRIVTDKINQEKQQNAFSRSAT